MDPGYALNKSLFSVDIIKSNGGENERDQNMQRLCYFCKSPQCSVKLFAYTFSRTIHNRIQYSESHRKKVLVFVVPWNIIFTL